MRWTFYGNTFAVAILVGGSAVVLLGMGRLVRRLMSKWITTKCRGLVSDAVREHLTMPATVMLALITAAMVAIVFLHQEILDSPDAVFAPWEAFTSVTRERESALFIVYFGVAGLMFAGLAFVVDALGPLTRHSPGKRPESGTGKSLERGRLAMARWAALSAAVSTAATLALVPAMLALLMSVFQLPQDLPADIVPPSRPRGEAQTDVPEGCAYLFAGGGEACSLLEDLGEGAAVPCDALPIETRPLQLIGDANPANYLPARLARHLVCTWTLPGEYVAGATIPAGDLRAVGGAVVGSESCRFWVFDDEGTLVVRRSDYAAASWGAYALIRLEPGDMILTGGCGWVPAQHAGLGVGPDGTIGVTQHAGRLSHPLIVGEDIAPGWTQIECEFWVWDLAVESIGSWVTALREPEGQRFGPGLYRITAGVVWPRC